MKINRDERTDMAPSVSIRSWSRPAPNPDLVQSEPAGLSEPGSSPRLLNSAKKDVFISSECALNKKIQLLTEVEEKLRIT